LARSHCSAAKGKFEAASGGEDSTVPEVEKAGRILSKANEGRIREAKENVEEAVKIEGTPRAAKALLREASVNLGAVLDGLGSEDGEDAVGEMTVKDAVGILLGQGTKNDRDNVRKAFDLFDEAERRDKRTEQYRAIWSG